MATVADRILDHLSGVPSGLDDGQLAQALDARRQTVNQACRRLAEQGRLHRAPGPGGVIVNRLFNAQASSDAPTAAAAESDGAAVPPASVDVVETPDQAAVPEPAAAVEPVAAVTDSPSVPQARTSTDDETPAEVEADDQAAVDEQTAVNDLVTDVTAVERTVVPAARNGAPDSTATSIPAARTSEADDSPAAVVASAHEIAAVEPELVAEVAEVEPVAVAEPEPVAEVEPVAQVEPAVSGDDAKQESVTMADAATPVLAGDTADVAQPDESVEPDGPDEASETASRPWWKRLLPWGNA